MVTVPVKSAAPGLEEASAPGDFVLVAHRGGQVSVFYDRGMTEQSSVPVLIDVLDGLPLEPSGIEFDPSRHLAYLSLYARSGSSGGPRLLSRVGLNVETSGDSPEQALQASYAYDAGSVVIDGVAPAVNTRAVRVNPARDGELLVTGEQPSMLLFVDPNTENETELGVRSSTLVRTDDFVSVGAGPYRMTLGKLGGREIVAVSCFDSKQLYLIDADSSDVVSVIQNLNGPFDLAIDASRKLLYLSDFRASTIQVIDLKYIAAAGASARTDAPIVALIGIPKVVQELQ